MPKSRKSLTIRLNLLKPQSNTEKVLLKLFRWLLSSGRFIFVFVEALVLIAFIARFKLDADLAATKEAIEEEIPYIESLRPYEILIRNTQLKLAAIDQVKNNSFAWPDIITAISAEIPLNTKITSINIKNETGNARIQISGQTKIYSDLSNFVANLKTVPNLNGVNITTLNIDEDFIKFSVEASGNSLTGKQF